MNEDIKTVDDVVRVCDKVLENAPEEKPTMRLHHKAIDALSKQEISYVQGQLDYIEQSIHLGNEIKSKETTRLKYYLKILTIALMLKVG